MKPPNFIHPTAVLDAPFRCYQGGKQTGDVIYRSGRIGANVRIGAGAIIGRGAIIEDSVVIDHQCIVEFNATIGTNALLIYRAIIGCEALIGPECVIGGFIAERCTIEHHCRIFGQLVHRQTDTTQSWDEHEEPEPSAIVRESSFIGFGAIVIGGVSIGPNAYVCAGTILTRDVPPRNIAFGVNKIVPAEQWPGKLSKNPAFQT